MKTGWIIGVVIFFLNMIDAFTTYYIFELKHEIFEYNNLMLFLVKYNTFLFPKIAIGITTFILIAIYWEKYLSVKIASLIVLVTYSWLIFYHYQGYRMLP